MIVPIELLLALEVGQIVNLCISIPGGMHKNPSEL